MILQRKGAWLVTFASLGLAGCQVVTGLSKLQADRTPVVEDGGLAAMSGESADRRDAIEAGASAGTGAPVTDPQKAAAGSGQGGAAHDNKVPAAGSGGKPTVDADADAGIADCVTRITYGSAWIRPANHTESWDDVNGLVTWDGTCQLDASGNSFAELSNGWRPFFTGRNGCVIAIDVQGSCAPPAGCNTRIGYGKSWLHPDGHSDPFDDVASVVTSDAACYEDGDNSFVVLSNGWQPHFMGRDSCAISFRYSQCHGLFANPVVDASCPDPSVLKDADQYVMACTSEGPEYPLHSSRDLVSWKREGSIFTQSTKPEWADSDYWSPELQRVGDNYLAYFSARHRDGDLAIGVATSSKVLGPYQDTGQPLLREMPGVIDPHAFEAADGTRYLLWKLDGDTRGDVASIRLQRLTADGLALTGSATTLLTNSESWEGTHIHSPWLSYVDGYYYLFYDAADAASDGSAIAIARASAIMGPYTKSTAPSLVSSSDWLAPGMGSPVQLRDGSWLLAFHAHAKGATSASRQVLLSRMHFADGWPLLSAASSRSQPVP